MHPPSCRGRVGHKTSFLTIIFFVKIKSSFLISRLVTIFFFLLTREFFRQSSSSSSRRRSLLRKRKSIEIIFFDWYLNDVQWKIILAFFSPRSTFKSCCVPVNQFSFFHISSWSSSRNKYIDGIGMNQKHQGLTQIFNKFSKIQTIIFCRLKFVNKFFYINIQ